MLNAHQDSHDMIIDVSDCQCHQWWRKVQNSYTDKTRIEFIAIQSISFHNKCIGGSNLENWELFVKRLNVSSSDSRMNAHVCVCVANFQNEIKREQKLVRLQGDRIRQQCNPPCSNIHVLCTERYVPTARVGQLEDQPLPGKWLWLFCIFLYFNMCCVCKIILSQFYMKDRTSR